MKKILSGLIPLLFCGAVFAQTEPAAKITAKNENQSALKVYEVNRSQSITGFLSTTKIEYMIENTTDRILEGEFEFPLKEGEKVTGYALDINGKMRDGVVIEKEKGRQVFEEVVRRGIDPGLIEMTSGNNFKTRVYPIVAKGVRHLSVTVEKEISPENMSTEQKAANLDKVFTQTSGKDTYFYFAEDLTDLLNQSERSEKAYNSGKSENSPKILIMNDVSASGKNRDIKKETLFLKAYLKKQNAIAGVANFGIKIFDLKDFGTDYEAMENFIQSQDFDGATCMNLDFSETTADKIIILSDGIKNWNENHTDGNNFIRNPKNIPVYTVNSSLSAGFTLLKKIAAENNGLFVNLSELSVEDSVNFMTQEPLRVLNIEYNQSQIEQIFPEKGTVVTKGFSVSGLLKKKSGTIKISIGRAGKIETVIEKTISAVKGTEADGIEKIWAGKKIDSLSADYDLNKSEILSLAKKYSIVTEGTSLIVLDNVNDYVRYGITPPADLKEEYDQLIKNQPSAAKQSDDSVPQEVYQYFDQFKKWWNKTKEEFAKEAALPVALPRTGVVRTRIENTSAVDSSNSIEIMDDVPVMESSAEIYENSAIAPQMAAAKTFDREMKADLQYSGSQQDSSESGAHSEGGAKISLQPWDSKSDYLTELKKTDSEKMWQKYLELKQTYGNSPVFYTEVSDYFASEELKDEALRILSNLAELNLENPDVLRTLGTKLMEQKYFNEAIAVFEKLTVIRGEIPQFLRDMAIACESAGQFQKAADSLWKIVKGKWDFRYSEIQMTALNDLNSLIARNKKTTGKKSKIDTSKYDKKLLENFDTDLRIVLTWNTDDCDVDLWVTDPNGEKCYYGHKQTKEGGHMSRDFTQGYGPEEFVLKEAPKGKYKIEANYFGNRQQKILQPIEVQAEIYTDFGRPEQKKQVMTLRLENIKNTFYIGDIEVQ